MLTELQIRSARPKQKPYKLTDGAGLYIEIYPHGSKIWRLKFLQPNGKETRLSLGHYPETSAPKARAEASSIKLRRKEHGFDPAADRRERKRRLIRSHQLQFEHVAREWYQRQKKSWSESNAEKVLHWLEGDLFPWLGKEPVDAITAADLLAVIRRVESRGAIEKAHRILNACRQIFDYAIVTSRVNQNPALALRGALSRTRTQHRASITDPKEVGQLLRAIDGYQGSPIVLGALKLAPLLFVRPGELRHAEWSEINFSTAEWHIPGHKMKMGLPLIVPLSEQALSIIEELKPLTGRGTFLFPGERVRTRPISDNTLNAALRRLGYKKDQMTAHGFRATARTLLDEVLGLRVDLIEHQLGHKVVDPNGRAYNRTSFLAQRKEMMQTWADYLDTLALES